MSHKPDRFPDPTEMLNQRVGIERPQEKNRDRADREYDEYLEELTELDRG